MKRNQAFRIHAYGGPDALRRDDVPEPEVAAGQLLVEVKAAGINGLDAKIREGLLRGAFPLPLPATLGVELAGVVSRVGEGVTGFKVGDRVMGPLAGLGAYANFVAVNAANLALTPEGLDDVAAAALPVASLAAWQSLRAAGELTPGQKVLIHGAAGGVGGFAVQFAKAEGATVWATASATSRDHVLKLGADVVIDRNAQRFESLAEGIDLVLDLVGGDVLDRSWQVLAPGGAIVSAVDLGISAKTPVGRKGIAFATRPDAARLRLAAEAVVSGKLRSTIAEVVGFDQIPAAVERVRIGHAPGKIVADFTR
ncbi:NADP-dependent oxidoreductase [Variovorax sp. J2P1-59]|uniref:NADP-dependent oxidoreductase n=1 Tax=Variovorax flavidus TaxID=3053501 RepID=UPI002578557A|nr:NADP-dependent oxidoreductase [Variovorax sp. J2P1-59]MDM0078147.1 NADP-dependent oxidoreductase [Variovorax sp. J2P1-59]